MLYNPKPTRAFIAIAIASKLGAGIATGLAALLKGRADLVYLEGMRPEELEDLGLRRTDDGGYKSFGR